MDLRYLERRNDPRTPTYVAISLLVDGREMETPAHLVDLSTGGAAVLLTTHNAPDIGEHLNVHFEVPNNDGGNEMTRRIEAGIVVNASVADRGVKRVGIRFFERPDFGTEFIDPTELLSGHKKIKSSDSSIAGRWQTARNFSNRNFATPAALPN